MDIFRPDVENYSVEEYFKERISTKFIFMEAYYETLIVIYDIVKSDPSPHTYLCTPHEIILRETQDWPAIQHHLEILAAEKLIVIKQLDKIAISISHAGIAKVKSFKNNFVNSNFTIWNENSGLPASKLKP